MLYPNLRAEMTRRGITQADIATFSGIHAATVNSWMQGRGSGFPIQKSFAVQGHFFPDATVGYLFAEVASTDERKPPTFALHTEVGK